MQRAGGVHSQSPASGEDHRSPPGHLGINDVGHILAVLRKVGFTSAAWWELGIELKLGLDTHAMETDHKTSYRCMLETVEIWLRNGDDPSWEALVDAVSQCGRGGKNIAAAIQREIGRVAEQSVRMSAGRGGATPNPQPVPVTHTPAQQTPSPAGSRPEDEGALIRAADSGDVAAVKRLIDRSVNVNCTDKDGWTPLAGASLYGHVEVVKVLISLGAHINQQIKEGATALYMASCDGNIEVVQLLIDGGSNINNNSFKDGATALIIASENGHVEVVQLLIGRGANINISNNEGATALYVASQHGNIEVVQLLIEGGARVNNNSFKTGGTALFVASQNGHLDVVQLLIERGADINICRKNGHTAIDVARSQGHMEVVRLLQQSQRAAAVGTGRRSTGHQQR